MDSLSIISAPEFMIIHSSAGHLSALSGGCGIHRILAPSYYDSITYELTGDEVVVKHGVWWRIKYIVPYSRIMSVGIVQGPISRRLG